MNFTLHNDLAHEVRAFQNRKLLPGEQNLYRSNKSEYGVLTLLPNLSGPEA